ncbi:MAG: flavodoxin domain-containing protein [Eubacteriales bacterium]|nr:flavodoxin domain-containing protein [Eubacteriales bacterium]
MNCAVRYYSRSGNTKALAEAIAKGAGTDAVSVDASGAELTEKTDILFVGGALYAYGLDKHLKKWLSGLDGLQVGKAVVFSTSWLSKHSLDLIRKALEEKGIKVAQETIYYKNMPTDSQLREAEKNAERLANS